MCQGGIDRLLAGHLLRCGGFGGLRFGYLGFGYLGFGCLGFGGCGLGGALYRVVLLFMLGHGAGFGVHFVVILPIAGAEIYIPVGTHCFRVILRLQAFDFGLGQAGVCQGGIDRLLASYRLTLRLDFLHGSFRKRNRKGRYFSGCWLGCVCSNI